jgi:hypothetical protein
VPICDVRVVRSELAAAMKALADRYKQVTMTIDTEPIRSLQASSELESAISVINATERDVKNCLLGQGIMVLASRERLR